LKGFSGEKGVFLIKKAPKKWFFWRFFAVFIVF